MEELKWSGHARLGVWILTLCRHVFPSNISLLISSLFLFKILFSHIWNVQVVFYYNLCDVAYDMLWCTYKYQFHTSSSDSAHCATRFVFILLLNHHAMLLIIWKDNAHTFVLAYVEFLFAGLAELWNMYNILTIYFYILAIFHLA